MNAKVNLYLPGEDEYAVPASVIYSEIAGRSEIAGAFKFASAGEAVKLAWKSAMRGENTIVVADAARFNKIKLLMLKAFPSKIEHSRVISDRVGDLLPADSRELKTETAGRVKVGLFIRFQKRPGCSSPSRHRNCQGRY